MTRLAGLPRTPHSPPMPTDLRTEIHLHGAAATTALAEALAPVCGAGDVIALTGEIGAGKSHFARALIRARLPLDQRHLDIPSPTFTLVQTYDADGLEIWHSDLYRLTHPDEVLELGLDEAFADALCLIEWPDRLGGDLPADALHLNLLPDATADGRVARLSATGGNWAGRLGPLLAGFSPSPVAADAPDTSAVAARSVQ